MVLSHGFDATRFSDTFFLEINGATSAEWVLAHPAVNQYSPSLPHGHCIMSSAVLPNANQLVLSGGCYHGGGHGGLCPSTSGWLWDSANRSWTFLPRTVAPRQGSAGMAPLVGSGDCALLWGASAKSLAYVTLDVPEPSEVDVFCAGDDMAWRRYKADTGVAEFPQQTSQMMVLFDGGKANSTDPFYLVLGGESPVDAARMWILRVDYEPDSAAPSEPMAEPKAFPTAGLHGIFMFLGWGLCAPSGVWVARYMRPAAPDGGWFPAHKWLQIVGMVFSWAGFITIWLAPTAPAFAHAIIGIIVQVVGSINPIIAIFRGHPITEKNATKKRARFNIFHWWIGRLCLILGMTNILLGLFLIYAPTAAWAFYIGYSGFVLFMFGFGEVMLLPGLEKLNRRTYEVLAGSRPVDGAGAAGSAGGAESGTEEEQHVD